MYGIDVREPMEWAEEGSIANRFSQLFVSSNDIGYKFKQAVADIVAGEYDREARTGSIRGFRLGHSRRHVQLHDVSVLS